MGVTPFTVAGSPLPGSERWALGRTSRPWRERAFEASRVDPRSTWTASQTRATDQCHAAPDAQLGPSPARLADARKTVVVPWEYFDAPGAGSPLSYGTSGTMRTARTFGALVAFSLHVPSRMLGLLGAALLALATLNCGGNGNLGPPRPPDRCSEAEANSLATHCDEGFLELCSWPQGYWVGVMCEPPGRCALGGDCGSDGWCRC